MYNYTFPVTEQNVLYLTVNILSILLYGVLKATFRNKHHRVFYGKYSIFFFNTKYESFRRACHLHLRKNLVYGNIAKHTRCQFKSRNFVKPV
jgi:hypothetical protein